jgi:hypothetical protein
VIKPSRPVKCLVSDGFTLVTAKFSSEAIMAMPEKHRNIANLGGHTLINISKFEIQASVLGIDSLVILIGRVEIIDATYATALGRPVALEEREAVKLLLKNLVALENGVAHGPTDAEMGPVDEQSQQFATQVRDRASSDVKLLQGVNLGGPVAPRRNDTRITLGTKPESDNSHERPNRQPPRTGGLFEILKLNPRFKQTAPHQPTTKLNDDGSPEEPEAETVRHGHNKHSGSPSRTPSFTVPEDDGTPTLEGSDNEFDERTHTIQSPEVQKKQSREDPAAEFSTKGQSSSSNKFDRNTSSEKGISVGKHLRLDNGDLDNLPVSEMTSQVATRESEPTELNLRSSSNVGNDVDATEAASTRFEAEEKSVANADNWAVSAHECVYLEVHGIN